MSIESLHRAEAPVTGRHRIVRTLLVITAVAVVLNLVAYALGHLAGADMRVTQPGGATSAVVIPAVLLMTIVPLVIGGLLLVAAARFWRPGVRVLRWLGLAVGVLTVPMPLFSNATPVTVATLAMMHVIVGVVWFIGVGRAERPTPAQR